MEFLKDNRRIADKEFYTQGGYDLAKRLIGKYICRNYKGEVKKYLITETECYIGTEDTACHAHKGKTERTKIMWEEGGVCYVYLCYGIHNMLNFVSGEKGSPQAVLIRGVRGYNGPGKLTKELNIDRSFNGESLLISDRIWLEEGEKLSFSSFKRVGIDYAEEKDREALWRFAADFRDKC